MWNSWRGHPRASPLGERNILPGQRDPFLRLARFGFEQVSEGEACAKTGAIDCIEGEEPVGWRIVVTSGQNGADP